MHGHYQLHLFLQLHDTQQEIHEKIMSLDFEDCKVFVSTVDSQSSAENGIVVQVVGELSNRGGPWRKFAQTFFLAEQPNGYFVLNDIFRYIKEESDEEEEEVAEAETPATSTSVHEHATAIPTAAPSQPQQTESLTNAVNDLDIKDAHGTPESAAPVTVSLTSEHGNDAKALEGLANGTEQQQVVELHDEIEQPPAPASAAAASAAAEEPVAAQTPASQARVNGSHKPAAEQVTAPAQQPARNPQTSQPVESTKPAAAPAESSQAPPTQSTSAPKQATPAAGAAAAAAPAKPSGPPAPKTWATLAASGQNKWNTTVKSVTQGISSSVPASTSGSGSSTPVNAGTAGQSSTAAGKQADRGEGPSRSSAPRDATRTPQFMNVETGYSVIVHNVTAEISHGLLRNRLSEEFGVREGGQKKYAKLAYLDIDRQKGVAYIDFEKEWGMKKAIEKGSCVLDGVTVTIEAGKGNRRDASGLGTTKGAPPVGSKGRGSGQGRDGARGSGGGARGGQQGGRDGQSSSRGGGRSGGGQRPGQQ